MSSEGAGNNKMAGDKMAEALAVAVSIYSTFTEISTNDATRKTIYIFLNPHFFISITFLNLKWQRHNI